MKTKEQIIEWLKSNNLYDAFAKNISHDTVEQHIAERQPKRIFRDSFRWLTTDEGFDYWDNADSKFLQWLNSDEQTEQSADRWVFDCGTREAPFYMVHVEGRPARTHKYPLMMQATKEADRLAKSLNTNTYVLAAVMEIRPEVVTSAVGIEDMEHQEDNPF